ncbi:hypothetical protein APA_5244 [Pseudanabaena sp. lw0831]|nr:hypothetical protein APA_5244 [Pseudanabaena sp. lw0831]
MHCYGHLVALLRDSTKDLSTAFHVTSVSNTSSFSTSAGSAIGKSD